MSVFQAGFTELPGLVLIEQFTLKVVMYQFLPPLIFFCVMEQISFFGLEWACHSDYVAAHLAL